MHLSDFTPPGTPAARAARALAERYHSESMQNPSGDACMT